MITKNLENLMAMNLLSCATLTGQLRVVTVTGAVRYLDGNFGYFPTSRAISPTKVATTEGISIGSGGRSESQLDYQLEETITSGVSLSLSATTPGVNADGNAAIKYKITVTNTGSAELTVQEVGYKQKLKAVTTPGGSWSTDDMYVCLLDRTVLETPVVIQPGDAGIIEYTLAVYFRPQTKAGVEMVPFDLGTDEQIAAMIDAAQAGTIDLHSDAGWMPGDCRKIHLAAWTGGGDTAHAAADAIITIADFGDYNECGSVMQFDILSNAAQQRIHDSNTPLVGYGETEMYTTTLPALVEALPSWLKSRLRTFDVIVGLPHSEEVETVGDNKLALRAPVEINPNGGNYSEHGRNAEGTQCAVYALDSVRARNDNTTWLRSPTKVSGNYYISVTVSSTSVNFGSPNTLTESHTMFAFGCV